MPELHNRTRGRNMTDDPDHIRDLTQQYADNHPGVPEAEARRRVLVLEGIEE